MAGIRIALFGGVFPRMAARQLQDHHAQIALNTRLLNGQLAAWNALSSTVVTPSKSGTKRTIYRFGQDVTNEAQYWLHWTDDVNVVRGPVQGDTSERTYWTGEAEPRVTDSSIALSGGGTDYPNNHWKLGVPSPANTPSVVLSGSGSGVERTRSYVYTWVTGYGEEGPPSTPSDEIDVQDGETVTVGNMSTSMGAGYNGVSKNIYRIAVGETGAAYKFVASVAAATTSYADTLTDAELGESLPSTDWAPPPSSLFGLVAMPNQILAGIDGNDIYFCEPGLPHAWPTKYIQPMRYKPVGLVVTNTGELVVGTKGKPSLFTGVHPSEMTEIQIQEEYGCVSKRSMASVAGVGAVFACPTGLVIVGPNGALLGTESIFTRKEWQDLVPSSIDGYGFEGKYFGFYDTGAGTQQGFIFDPKSPNAPWVYTDVYATAGYNDPVRDALYLCISGAVKRWAGGSGSLTYQWKSKVFALPKPANLACAQVHAATYPVTFKLYADGSLKTTKSVTSSAPFRLPAGYKATEIEVDISGTSEVKAVYLAESVNELKAV